MEIELRVQNAKLTSSEDGSMTVSGYVNETGKLSNILGVTKKFVEKIAPGAFQRAIDNSQRDIDFLAEHDNKKILASTRNGSLKLKEDDKGLFMSATIAPTSWGRDYYELIKAGILKNMSFGFRTIKDSWRSIDLDLFERTVEELELFEVSVVRDPAYSQSSIAARGIDLIEDVEVPQEVVKENRFMKELKQMLTALEERVNTLAAEVQELRSVKEEVEEVRKELAPKPEVVEEQPGSIDASKINVSSPKPEEPHKEEKPTEVTEKKTDKPVDEKPQEKVAEKTEEKSEDKKSEEEKSKEEKPNTDELSKSEKVEDEKTTKEQPDEKEKDKQQEDKQQEDKQQEDKQQEDKQQERSNPLDELTEFRNKLESLKK